ncbi:MAG: hypothetical protein Q8L14_26620 [Myxococcales bacterium]|nr:hypothetical protein [Myxococcales bacterium]
MADLGNLPEGTRVFRYVPDRLFVLLGVTAIPMAFGVVMLAVDFAKVRASPAEFVPLLAVFISPFLVTVLLSWRRRRLSARIARGEAQFGLFLLPDRLVFVVPGSTALEAERTAITGTALARRLFSKGGPAEDTVVIQTHSGAFDVPARDLDGSGSARTLKAQLDAWLG